MARRLECLAYSAAIRTEQGLRKVGLNQPADIAAVLTYMFF